MSILLVTGAAGFIGSHTSKQLLDQGHTVVAIDDIVSGMAIALTKDFGPTS